MSLIEDVFKGEVGGTGLLLVGAAVAAPVVLPLIRPLAKTVLRTGIFLYREVADQINLAAIQTGAVDLYNEAAAEAGMAQRPSVSSAASSQDNQPATAGQLAQRQSAQGSPQQAFAGSPPGGMMRSKLSRNQRKRARRLRQQGGVIAAPA